MNCSIDTDSDEDDTHPDIPMTQKDFEELFEKSDLDSDFEGFK